jgi:hypothetical protein
VLHGVDADAVDPESRIQPSKTSIMPRTTRGFFVNRSPSPKKSP